VHAALILRDASADPTAIVAGANRRPESHQRIQNWSVWPEDAFPRTASTTKVKRGEVAWRIAQGQTSGKSECAESILARLKAGASTDAQDQGISAPERV